MYKIFFDNVNFGCIKIPTYTGEDEMPELACYACPSGVATHHQDGAKSWIECACGEYKGPKIDMSDTHHAKKALEGWQVQAQEYVDAQDAVEVEDDDGTGDDELDDEDDELDDEDDELDDEDDELDDEDDELDENVVADVEHL